MSGQVLAGAFTRDDPSFALGQAVLVDGQSTALTAFTGGSTRLAQLPFQPNLTETWQVIGYSTRIRMGLAGQGAALGQMWGRLGNLWAGLVTDSSLKPSFNANFPIDLSTFVKVFDGGQDDLRFVNSPASSSPPGALDYTLLAGTFMLPQPIIVRSGSQVQMCLVLTPSMLTCSGAGLMNIIVQDCSYSVLYND